MTLTEADYVFVPLELLDKPANGTHEILVDRWWATRGGTELAFFRGSSPQCNSSEAIVRRLLPGGFDVVVVQIPVVFLRVHHFESSRDGEYMGMDWRYVLPKVVTGGRDAAP